MKRLNKISLFDAAKLQELSTQDKANIVGGGEQVCYLSIRKLPV